MSIGLPSQCSCSKFMKLSMQLFTNGDIWKEWQRLSGASFSLFVGQVVKSLQRSALRPQTDTDRQTDSKVLLLFFALSAHLHIAAEFFHLPRRQQTTNSGSCRCQETFHSFRTEMKRIMADLFHLGGAEGWAGYGSESSPRFPRSKQDIVVFVKGCFGVSTLKRGS